MFGFITNQTTAYNYLIEYLKTIERYKTYKIQAIPVRYLSLETNKQEFEDNLAFWTSPECKYKVYDLTPILYATPIVSNPTEQQHGYYFYFSGLLYVATLKPKLNDVIFFYNPIEDIGLRVTNLRVVPHLTIDMYEVDVEPSILKYKDIGQLNCVEHKVFFGKGYIDFKLYEEIYQLINELDTYSDTINQYFDEAKEIFFFVYQDRFGEQYKIADPEPNKVIYDIHTLESYFSFPILPRLKRPYGVTNLTKPINIDGSEVNLDDYSLIEPDLSKLYRLYQLLAQVKDDQR